MAILIDDASVAAAPLATGVTCKRLATEQRIKGTKILVNRVTLSAGSTAQLAVAAESIAWLQMVSGSAKLRTPFDAADLTEGHAITLPPGFKIDLSTDRGASLVWFEITDPRSADPQFEADKSPYSVINWMTEPYFQSKRDGRKRIVLEAPDRGGPAAFKAEMVIYPPASSAPMHRREGADTLRYVVSGTGTATTAEQSLPLNPGDLFYCPAGEMHRLQASESGEMRFVEFCTPGQSKTVWADPGQVSAWVKSDLDLFGRRPAREAWERRVFAYSAASWR